MFRARSQNCEKRSLAMTCLSIGNEHIGSHWKKFHEIWHFSILQKSVEKIQVSLKSYKILYIDDNIPLIYSYVE
jgi:hypothetical protein